MVIQNTLEHIMSRAIITAVVVTFLAGCQQRTTMSVENRESFKPRVESRQPPVAEPRDKPVTEPQPAKPVVERKLMTPEEREAALARTTELTKELYRYLKQMDFSFAETMPRRSRPSENAPYVGYVGEISAEIAENYRTVKRLDQLILADDTFGIQELEKEGLISWFSGKARIIQTIPLDPVMFRSDLHYCEIRIMEGPLAGQTRWCSMTQVQEKE